MMEYLLFIKNDIEYLFFIVVSPIKALMASEIFYIHLTLSPL